MLYFENTRCVNCQSPLGFWAQSMNMTALVAQPNHIFAAYGQETLRFRYCHNATHQACNWLLTSDSAEEFCEACQLNRTVPNLSHAPNLKLWRKLEVAKHRLIYSLMRLGLPIKSKEAHPDTGLAFDFLEDETLPSGSKRRILTGHADGLITINIDEADDALRVQTQQSMGERYRTLLGHFRHEVGHYYWNLIVWDTPYLNASRSLFGDDRQDYSESLKRHYAQGAPEEWSTGFISAYASSHPWEDWAETWAHYLHMTDTLATAYAFGLRVSPRAGDDPTLKATIDQDPYQTADFDLLYGQWLPLTTAMNSINRSMGQPDMYPFIIPTPVVKKLKYVHTVCKAATVR